LKTSKNRIVRNRFEIVNNIIMPSRLELEGCLIPIILGVIGMTFHFIGNIWIPVNPNFYCSSTSILTMRHLIMVKIYKSSLQSNILVFVGLIMKITSDSEDLDLEMEKDDVKFFGIVLLHKSILRGMNFSHTVVIISHCFIVPLNTSNDLREIQNIEETCTAKTIPKKND
jgi:hypothetical protein